MSGTIESQLRYHAKHPETPELMRYWALKAVDELKYRTDVIEQRNAELKRGRDDFMQALTDPENQPSQWGTVTLEMYERLEAKKAALKSAKPVAQPLPDSWICERTKQPWIFETVKQWVREIEAAHGIGAKE